MLKCGVVSTFPSFLILIQCSFGTTGVREVSLLVTERPTMRTINNVGRLFTLISCLRVKCHLTAIAHFRLTTRLSLIVSGNLCVQWNGSNLTEAWAEGGERELNIPTNCNITGLNGLLLNGEWCISILKWMWLVWAPRRSKLLSSSHSSPRDWWSLLSASLLTACDNPDSQPIMMTSTTPGRVYFFRPS